MRKSIMYVGMDQHKESIEIATADRRTGQVAIRLKKVKDEQKESGGYD